MCGVQIFKEVLVCKIWTGSARPGGYAMCPRHVQSDAACPCREIVIDIFIGGGKIDQGLP